MKWRAAVFGLLVAAVLALSAGPSLAAAKAPPRPTLFAVGTTSVKFDNQGRSVATTVYYPATGRATTLSIDGAPRATKWGPYPLIVFSHDLRASPTPYARLLHAWAAAGYVVAVPTYEVPGDDEADENGQFVVDLGERVTDASFLIDRMLDRVQGGFGTLVDRRRIAAAGHGLGSTTTYVLSYLEEGADPRVRAVVTIGGSLAGDPAGYFSGFNTPLLAIHGEADEVDPIDDALEVFALAKPPKFFVTLLGADGTSPFASASDPAAEVVEETTLDFFTAYLRGRSSGLDQLARDGKTAEVSKIRIVLPERRVDAGFDRGRSTVYESFATVWEAIADAIPDATAVVQADRRVRWREVEDHAARLAAGLSAEGIGTGAHVALFLFNCPEYMECLFACSKLRALSANVNFRYESGELAALLENADAEALVFHRSLGHRVAAVRDQLPKLRVLIEIDDGGAASAVPDAIAYDDLIAAHDPVPRIERSGDDLLLWYTGGTTGLPKGVLWHQGTLLNYGAVYAAGVINRPVPESVTEAAECAVELLERDYRPVPLLTTPLVHATAVHQANTWFSVGGMVALLPRGPVDGDVVCATIERERVTLLSLVGDVILRRIVRALEAAEARGEPYDLSSLRRVHNSGAMVNATLKDALLSRGAMSFYDSLGSSEAVGFGLALTSAPGEHRTARFVLGPRARVINEDGRDVVPGSGEHGLLAVSESSAIGYYKDPERSAVTFREIDGTPYAMPGDWAIVHDDQTITLLGRGSGCINTGGEKVWPEEVEEVLKTHPAVVDAIVVGLPDDEWGETVAAVVSLGSEQDGDTPTPDELSAWVGQLLASYKRPRRLVVVDQVQRTTVGKADYAWARAVLS